MTEKKNFFSQWEKAISSLKLGDKKTKKEAMNKIKKQVWEELADLEHRQWAHWTKHMLEHLTPENIEKWKKQIETPYFELSEQEKLSDRSWAKQVINILENYEIEIK